MIAVGIILVITGAFFGAAIADIEGFIFGGITGYLVSLYFSMRGRLGRLEKQVTELHEKYAAQKPAEQDTAAAGRKAETVAEARTEEPTVETAAEPIKKKAEDVIKAAIPSPPATPSSIPDTSKPVMQQTGSLSSSAGAGGGSGGSGNGRGGGVADDAHYGPGFDKLDGLIERIKTFFTTGNVMVRIGLVVLFFGVGFLLKYAAEHSLVPIELRLAAVGLGGIVMLIIGWRLRDSRRAYGLLMQGGAIGIIYLTLFAAFKFYDFIPPGMALVFMLVLVVLSAILAILQDAKSLALFGAAGGFLAPVLTSTGGGSHVMLFSYYALLNAGILGIAWYKAWRELNLLGFVFTFVIGSAWGYNYYGSQYFMTTEPFLILFFLFFVAIAVLFAFRQPPRLKGYVDGSLVFGVPIVAFSLQASLVKNYEYGMAFSALALSAFYIIVAGSLWKRNQPGMRMLTEAFLALGVVFGSLAIPLALDGRWTAAAWALEGAALVWVGVRQQRLLARLFGLILQVGAGLMFLADSGKSPDMLAVFNGIYLGCVAISLAGFFSSFYLQRFNPKLKDWEGSFHIVLLVWAGLWWYVAGMREVEEFVSHRYQFAGLILFFTASSAAAWSLYRRLSWQNMYYIVMLLLPLSAFVLLAQAVDHRIAHPFTWLGYLAWPLAMLVHYLQLYKTWQQENTLPAWTELVQHRGALWLFTIVISWELAWVTDWLVKGAGTWADIMWVVTPALLVFGISALGLTGGMKDTAKLRWPFKQHYADYFGVTAIPLIVAVIMWSLFMSAFNAGDPWPLPYIPLINPLDLSQIFALMALLHWTLHARREPQLVNEGISTSVRTYVLSAVAFIWINSVIARTIHHGYGVPFDWFYMAESSTFHTAISVLWTLLALLITVLASYRQHRQLWFVGAGLLAVVVVKLFVVDLSSTGTIARIVSFLVVGILMLLIGFFSPLPPKADLRPKQAQDRENMQ